MATGFSILPIDPVTSYRITHFQVPWHWINLGIKPVGNYSAHTYGVVLMLKNHKYLADQVV